MGATLALTILFPALGGAQEESFLLQAGTTLQVRLTTTLSSRTSQTGDLWTGKVVEPVFSEGREVVPVGSLVEGKVTFVKEPGRVKGKAEMRLIAETITTPDEGIRYSIVASLEDARGAEGAKVEGKEGTIEGPGKSKKGTAVEAGAGAGAGAAVGAIASGGDGALYGAGIGALAGLEQTGNVLGRERKDIVLPQGTEMTFVISRTTVAKRVTPPPESWQ